MQKRFALPLSNTDCTQTLRALFIYFCGASLAKQMYKNLFVHTSFKRTVSNDAATIEVDFKQMLVSSAFALLNPEDLQRPFINFRETIERKAETWWLMVQETMPSESVDSMADYFKGYDFNRPLFNKFQSDLFDETVNSEKSQVFFCVHQSSTGPIHCWTIELFWEPHSQQPAYRLYFSWVMHQELKQQMTKSGYTPGAPWHMTTQQMQEFLNTFEKCICLSPYSAQQVGDFYKQLFGYTPCDISPKVLLNSDGLQINGTTFCYIKQSFQPKQPILNLMNFIRTDLLLRASFKRDPFFSKLFCKV